MSISQAFAECIEISKTLREKVNWVKALDPHLFKKHFETVHHFDHAACGAGFSHTLQIGDRLEDRLSVKRGLAIFFLEINGIERNMPRCPFKFEGRDDAFIGSY